MEVVEITVADYHEPVLDTFPISYTRRPKKLNALNGTKLLITTRKNHPVASFILHSPPDS